MKNKKERTSVRKGSFWRTFFRQRELVLMVIPGIVVVFIFNYIPIYGILIAFQDYNPMKGFFGSDWVGLKYFQQFFQDPFLFRLVKNTLLLGVYSLLWGFPAPIILAILLDQITAQKFKKIVQSISYLPYFISVVVVVGIVKNFVGVNGVVYEIVTALTGKENISILTDPGYFRTLFISSGIWQGVGWGSIIYLAALSNVDPQLHEAAIIDGANRWQRIRYITWPAIVPTTSIMLIFSISGILGSDFQKALLLGSEATYETSDIIGTYVYRLGILGGRFEYTTAIGLLMSFVSLILLSLANFVSRQLSENSLW